MGLVLICGITLFESFGFLFLCQLISASNMPDAGHKVLVPLVPVTQFTEIKLGCLVGWEQWFKVGCEGMLLPKPARRGPCL